MVSMCGLSMHIKTFHPPNKSNDSLNCIDTSLQKHHKEEDDCREKAMK